MTITDCLNTPNPLSIPPTPAHEHYFNLNKTRGILKLRPAQRNPTEFHKYRSNRKEYQQVTKTGRKSYTKTDNIVVPDLQMLRTTAKRSVEVPVVSAKIESLQEITLTMHSVAIRLCICPTVPSPASWAKGSQQLSLWIY